MLLYYFTSKDELVVGILQRVSEGLIRVLESSLPQAPILPADMYSSAVATLTSKQMRPAMRLWFEVAAKAARDEEPYASVAREVIVGWTAWAAVRLATSTPNEDAAHAIVAAIEGRVLLSLMHSQDLAAADAWLAARL